MSGMNFRPRPDQVRRSQRGEFGETMTEQHHAEKCEIHNIMKRYQQTGVVDHVAQYQGTYNNFIDAPSFKEALDQVAEAQSMFESLPSSLRADMQNDPSVFLEFIQNPDNIEAIAAYGLDTSHLEVDPVSTTTAHTESPVEAPVPSESVPNPDD